MGLYVHEEGLVQLSAEENTVLQAYSNGEMGWREACKALSLIDHRELHALLQEYDLPLPPEDDTPLDTETKARLDAFLHKDKREW